MHIGNHTKPLTTVPGKGLSICSIWTEITLLSGPSKILGNILVERITKGIRIKERTGGLNPYPRNHALWRIWPFLAITHFHAFTVSSQSRILTQNVSLGTFQSSITHSTLITRRNEVKLVSVKSERSVLYVYNKIIDIPCISCILETAEFDRQLIIARSVKFQINDVMSAHWPAYYMKTRIITKTLILH